MHQVHVFLRKFYRGIGTSYALEQLAALERGGVAETLRVSGLNPSAYSCPDAFKWDQAACEITRKLQLPGDKAARRQRAVDNFWAAETQCCDTNARLHRFWTGELFPTTADHHVMEFITLWRKEMKRALGPLPDVLDPGFSRGSTLSDSGEFTTIPDKMSSRRTVYKDCIDIFRHAIRGTFLERYDIPPEVIVRANRFFTVPKDSMKDRGCCMEASAALMLQLAVGRLLKRRYRWFYKVDLRHAKPIHMQLAKLASVSGEHATIDLSNASDTVARLLVRLILPPDWYALLDSLRATHTNIDGREVFLEKFSSMGNGFTFELETFLFRTLCAAIGVDKKDCHVFGDDIIVPTEHSRAVLAALRYFGFTPNEKKTFCEGPFRESCGGDYFSGLDVRAHYMEEIPDEPQKWISLANGLRRIDPYLQRLHAAWRYCVDQVPVAWRVFGPASLGDGCFHDPDACPAYFTYKSADRKTSRLPGWRVWHSVPKKRSLERYDPHTQLGAVISGCEAEVAIRDAVTGYRPGWVVAYGVDWAPSPVQSWPFVPIPSS